MSATARQLWLDPGFGASGDMMLGALIGLGASPEVIRHDLEGLDVAGWDLTVGTTKRASISATRAAVTTAESPTHRRWSAIDRLLAESSLPDGVRDCARQTFELLGRAEAGVHDIDIDEVHFHEVGAVDAIVDIVGSWSALRQLSIDQVVIGPIGLGHGRVQAAHGSLPVPAPATLALLHGAQVHSVDTPTETVTPTGAALLVSMADTWGAIPAGSIVASARGAGGRNPETHPNVLTAVLIEGAPSAAAGAPSPARVLATNIDDVTPELLGHALDRLLAAGADDAWVVPVAMKKNRPGHELRVLCSPGAADELRQLIFELTGSLGMRTEEVIKHALARTTRTISVRGHEVRVKVGPFSSKPEYDDLVAASEATGITVRQLTREAVVIDSGDRV